jgi:hypothetical protein
MSTRRENRTKRYFLSTVITVFAIWVLYAVMRYIIAKNVGFEHFPLFVLNKAFASTAAVLIGLSFVTDVLSRWKRVWKIPSYPIRKYFGLAGFASACVHAIMSVIVMKPAYFHEFHEENGTLNAHGEAALLFGILAFLLFGMSAVLSIPSVYSSLSPAQQRATGNIGYWGFMILMLHVFTIGIRQWLDPSIWPGGLVPLSLLVFSVLFGILLTRGVSEIIFSK